MPQSRIRHIVRRKAPAKETRTMPLTAGIRLGPHEMLGLIGAGARGAYRAPDIRLDRTVAVKILPANISC
jgi:hypothetical protein